MGKRTKQYKRLMRSFEQLGFRQPYQLLLTSDVILDTTKLDLVYLFEKTLSTKNLKPMITQCCIRALYAKNAGPNRDPTVVAAIERAKTFERRRCGHLMDEDPQTEYECMMSVVDPKKKGENKFRYVVVTQDDNLRARLRSVVPTPLMYVKRSVVILEPMASSSAQVREREERAKFLEGIVRRTPKRKREEDESDHDKSGKEDGGGGSDREDAGQAGEEDKPKKKKKAYGKKQPNPLAVKKNKTTAAADQKPRRPAGPTAEASTETKAKRKRRKKASGAESGEGGAAEQAGGEETAAVDAAED
ncbi:hypothetical protein BT67DRAFT_451416 [Trichocladium antarcticum]|uniref:U three protein 23 n=1 Tax=Trichocladium antarcticum TaxID=1450529 RepID=A0AAN6UFY3_9PEZI|nr:hypothetical protein BT67DRAFT_451416 [Trichocladium antarcticum]